MSAEPKPRSDVKTAVYIALGALLLVLVGLGVMVALGGSGEPEMVYEGFN